MISPARIPITSAIIAATAPASPASASFTPAAIHRLASSIRS